MKMISIYQLKDHEGKILYVGASNNPRNRAKHHRRRFAAFTLTILKQCSCPELAADWERHFIRRLKPIHNKRPGGGHELFYSHEQRQANGRKAWQTRIANLDKQNGK